VALQSSSGLVTTGRQACQCIFILSAIQVEGYVGYLCSALHFLYRICVLLNWCT